MKCLLVALTELLTRVPLKNHVLFWRCKLFIAPKIKESQSNFKLFIISVENFLAWTLIWASCSAYVSQSSYTNFTKNSVQPSNKGWLKSFLWFSYNFFPPSFLHLFILRLPVLPKKWRKNHFKSSFVLPSFFLRKA